MDELSDIGFAILTGRNGVLPNNPLQMDERMIKELISEAKLFDQTFLKFDGSRIRFEFEAEEEFKKRKSFCPRDKWMQQLM